MLTDATYLAAFLVGLMGGAHCVGMCGGVVGALSLGLPQAVRERTGPLLGYMFAYNAGRIASYTVAGALMGGIGWWATSLLVIHDARLVLQAVAGLFMLALGAYLGGWWHGLVRLEQAGSVLWRRVEPIGRRLLPVSSIPKAFGFGLVWGWLPCGLVYTVLIWSISAGSVLKGGLLMLAFGLGTLPTLLAMGTLAGRLSALIRQPWVRRLAGAVVIALGLWLLLQLGLTASGPSATGL